jgi:hypothetical protein
MFLPQRVLGCWRLSIKVKSFFKKELTLNAKIFKVRQVKGPLSHNQQSMKTTRCVSFGFSSIGLSFFSVVSNLDSKGGSKMGLVQNLESESLII